MGGADAGGFATTKVYSVSLPALISQLNSDGSAKDTQIWKELPRITSKPCPAPLSISGSLLAVGGMEDQDKPVSALHLYRPGARQWVKVKAAYTPTPRYNCTCMAIDNSELIVAGGYNKDMSAQVHLAKIL